MLTLVIGNKNYSSWSLRPWIYLRQQGIAFEEVNVSLYQGDYKAQLARYTPAGKVRSLVMPDDRVVKELLAASSQYSYTYTMLERPEMADYRSTVAVIPLDKDHSRIELIVSLSASGETTEEQITERYTKNLRGNLRAMKKALGLPNERPPA